MAKNKIMLTDVNLDVDIELTPSDSISHVSSGNFAASSSSVVARRIELERKRPELQSIRDMAKVRRLRLLAEAKAEARKTLAKLRLESTNLEAEEKLLARSERGSSVSAQTKPFETKIALRSRVVGSLLESSQPNQKAMNFTKRDLKIEVDARDSVQKMAIPSFSGASHKTAIDPQQPFASHLGTCLMESKHQLETPRQMPYTCVKENESLWMTYLDRQGRNEFINLASHIGCDRKNIAFVFYENQIRRFMSESPSVDRKLEVLQASCVGQPPEMINLFCAPMKGMSTSQQIEKTFDRLRQGYAFPGASLQSLKSERLATIRKFLSHRIR